MSGNTKATIIFSLLASALFAALAFFGWSLCAPVLSLVLGLAVGYVGGNMQKDDPAKTARIARAGLRAGLIVGVAGVVGQIVETLIGGGALDTITLGCVGLIAVAVCGFFGWVGGWSWARQEHERQTGYKPT